MQIVKELKDCYLLPLKYNSKIPCTKHGFHDAKQGFDIVAHIKLYNIGLALSKSSMICLDCDVDETRRLNGLETLKIYESELGSLPETLTQSTPRGGRHFIYIANGIINPIGKIGNDIDVKYNGYIVMAPSSIDGKEYKFTNGIDEKGNFVIAELPQSWIDYLNKKILVKCDNPKISACKNVNQNGSMWKKVTKPFNCSIDRMIEKCNFLQYAKTEASKLPEPLWYYMITILAPIKDSNDVIHELSSPYPNYSYEETQKKIDRIRNYGFTPSCDFLSANYPEICGNCPKSICKKGDNNYDL